MSEERQEEPHNANAETWLLGGVFQDPRKMAAITGMLCPSDFYSQRNRHVWEAMQALQKENKPIDIVSVGSLIDFNSLFGNSDYLFMLNESVPSAANIEYYVELVKEASRKRSLISLCRGAISNAYDPTCTASHCLQHVMDGAARIATETNNTHIEHIGDIAERMLADIAQRKKEGRKSGIGSDFLQMDNMTGGFRKGELTVVGARPGVGKTAFAIGLAINAAKSSGPVLMFSLEMTGGQTAARAMGYYSQVSVKKTIDATLDMVEMQNQKEAVRVLRNCPLYIDLVRDHTVDQITSIAHSYAAKIPLSMVIVDYLQIVRTNPDRKHYENRNIAIGEITRALKILSGKLDCPVIALSQLNRGAERFVKPRLSDLRESGNIEQDADVVILLHRIPKPEQGVDITQTDLIIAKNRSGPTGECKIHFNLQNAMFSEYEQYTY